MERDDETGWNDRLQDWSFLAREVRRRSKGTGRHGQTSLLTVNSLLSGSFLINSSLSAPTKIEELTAGSDEKKHSD